MGNCVRKSGRVTDRRIREILILCRGNRGNRLKRLKERGKG